MKDIKGVVILNRPNLLIIHTDQQNLWTLGIYGGNLIQTPNIDLIGREGAVLNNFFTVSAVCTPSRGCLITGRYPHCHGAYRNNIELDRNETTIAHILAANGYKTGYIGKWHLDGEKHGWVAPERSMGFQDNRFMFNRGHSKRIIDQQGGSLPYRDKRIGDEKTYTTDWLTNKSIKYIKENKNNPFFLMLSIPDPHMPYNVREPYSTMYDPEDMPVPVTFNQEKRPFEIIEQKDMRKMGWTEKKLKEVKAQYCGEVKCIDDNTGRILECLSELDILDNTIVIFTTDHGDYMGEHGLYDKNQLYETAYRIPFLIRWPEKIEKGAEINQFFSVVDIQQTVLSLMDVEPSGKEQGRDGSPLLCGNKIEWDDCVFIHHSTLKKTGIFTPGYELAYVKEGGHILFDRQNDPLQVENLFGMSEYNEIVNRLKCKVVNHNKKYDSPAGEWLDNV